MSSDGDTPPETVPSEVLGDRPQGDRLARDVARAHVANALFATDTRVEVGRYRLLQRIGAGGMGVVWGAWDPELARRVAIKLVRAPTEAARARMLAEGQTLAKLSHPNVVPIYDVGVVDDQVYLVMEWVPGENLRAYCKQPRGVREVVAIYRAAGVGLAAAHDAGLVHRDFKPDNVMVGDDHRVRVLDFGLAREMRDDAAATDELRGAGTPRYMAPEQERGEPPTSAADQYAFCVSLRESLELHGAALPRWIAAVVARGTAASPGDRFATMTALLHALDRDPRTVWRRRALAIGAIAATAVAFTAGTLRATGPEPCGGAAGDIARAWNPQARDSLYAHGRELGGYGADEAAALSTRFTDYAARWAVAHHDACLAHRSGELTPALYERRLACFARARGALDAVVAVVTRAPSERFPDAVLAARALPDVDRCALDAPVEPPDRGHAQLASALGVDAARASYLALAGDPEAIAVAGATARAADVLAYAPLVARARLALGSALAASSPKPAITAYARAADAALAASDDVTFVEAFARELFLAAREHTAELDGLVTTLPFVETVARRTGSSGQFSRALLYNNVGTARLAAGDVPGARAWFRKAAAEPQPEDRGAELWAVLGNLAMTVDDRGERDRLFAEERTRLDHTLGPHHAFTLQARLRAAQFVEHPASAAAQLAEICVAFEQWYPARADKIGECDYELGWLAFERGDREHARDVLARVPATAPRHERAALVLALFDGDLARADRDATAFAQRTSALPSWFLHFQAVDAWLVAASARTTLGKRAEAIAALRAARAILAEPGFNPKATFYRRRLGSVDAQLAILGCDATSAAAALAWYRDAGGYDELARAVTARDCH